MTSDREHAISLGTTFGSRLWSLKMAILDHLAEPDPPSTLDQMAPSTSNFSTYAKARRTFDTVLSEEFSPRHYMHQMIILDDSNVLRWDVTTDFPAIPGR